MSLEQTIGNLEIRYANMVTFVGSSNTMVDTTTGRIQTKGIQHNSNVITDVSGPHGRVAPTLKKYPEIAFADEKFDSNESTNTYVQAGYTVSASSDQSQYNLDVWRVFDGVKAAGNGWASQDGTYYDGTTPTNSYTGITHQLGTGTAYGEWVKLELPNKIKVSKFTLYADLGVSYGTDEAPKSYKIYGSVTGSSWSELKDVSNETPSTSGNSHTISDNTAYRYLGIVVTQVNTNQDNVRIGELEFYGYEEDPPAGDHSVDTTFKSRFNNPQLTGVQVLVDGATGVGTNQISGGADPSGNQATMTSPNKYWTLNGTLTSNISVEANTFLEGDQPHAVSVWFNSSNLEANVSNTCVFSIASEEKLNSQNLDLQSNTWHNLTYAYQGEGGSKVTYLDGRKVAEDQAEDTFGDYPPFAMTGYAQGGYVVSASSEVNSSWKAWQAFNETLGNSAWHTDGGYDASGAHIGGRSLAGHVGDWIQIENPDKLNISYFNIRGRDGSAVQLPKAIKLIGSNTGIDAVSEWDVLFNTTDAELVNTVTKSFVVNSTESYKYYAFVFATNETNSSIAIAEIYFYGHRENDLVRLPDPTNVLKYPHIAMTGPAQRGYVASASSLYAASDHYHPWKPFDGSASNDVGAWLSEYDPVTYDGSGNPNSTDSLGNIDGVATPVNGSWLKLELPHKLKLSKVLLYRRNSIDQKASLGFIYGSNDDVNWTTIGSIANGTNLTTYTDTTPMEVTSTDTTNSYKYFIVHVTKVDGSDGYANFGQVEYYGTGVDSIPIQIGGGNIDKVANFRVYDKFIGEDQALEIWNAQKEEFGRAKPQMVLQQGKLGIGTDAPQGSLSVADEPHVPGEFPPGAMTDNNTYFAGHGTFKASASSVLSDTYKSWYVFNDTGTDVHSDAWLTPQNRYTLNNYIDVDPSVAANINGVYGEWLELKLPYKITLDSLTIKSRAGDPWGRPGGPAAGNVWGSNDGLNWTLLTSFTGLTYGGVARPTGVQESVLVNSTIPYSYFRLQPTKRVGVNGTDGWIGFGELSYFGTREQGQSILHDGQLTLTKSLNVMGDIRYITSHPLALPTMWDHMANGNCAKGVYPIVGTQGGDKIYNVYCEPDLAGGGWMCMAQISRNGYQVRSHPTNGDLDLFTKSIGDSKNIRWDNTFAVPINILSNNSGYDLDVMVYISGGSYASRYEGGMRLGAVWRGANLSQAFNPGRTSGIVDRSGLATSADGYTFTPRTPITGGDYGIQTSGSWYYSIAGSSGQGSYADYGYSDGGWIFHQGDTSNHVGKLYGGLHKDDGTAEGMSSSANWVCARIFVRPSIY